MDSPLTRVFITEGFVDGNDVGAAADRYGSRDAMMIAVANTAFVLEEDWRARRSPKANPTTYAYDVAAELGRRLYNILVITGSLPSAEDLKSICKRLHDDFFAPSYVLTVGDVVLHKGEDFDVAKAIYRHYRWEVGHSDDILTLRKHGIALKIGEKG